MPLVSIDPLTGQRLARYPIASPSHVASALVRAHATQILWRESSWNEKAALIRRLATCLRTSAPNLGSLITSEMGKPIRQALGEVEKCATACDYYARHGRTLLTVTPPPGTPKEARIVAEPLGIVLAIMPWNFPLWQAFRAVVPALVAGNTVLLKHASNVSGCALAIGELFVKAGFPQGSVQTLLIPASRIPSLIADPRVRAVTITGSTEAGRSVAALAGAALKPCVCELGGSDPYLILKDADLDLAAEICATARLINTGQSCIAGKRFIVEAPVVRPFIDRFAARLAARRSGDPSESTTDIGPLARADLRDEVHRQVTISVRKGAHLVMGGKCPTGRGFFYPTTLLAAVRPGQPAFDQEVFGPVAAVIQAANVDEAIALANHTPFGLGGAVFTGDRRTARSVASRIETGLFYANDFVRSDPSLPFGGVKQSGFGRELADWGPRSFMNVRTLWGC